MFIIMKHRLVKKLQASLWAAAGMSLALSPAYARDTEVYTQIKPAAGEQAPAMMFMLDTSGSMGNTMTGGTTRMKALKDAMKLMLLGGTYNGVTYSPLPGTIKVGYSRYDAARSNYYGVVPMPARPLDALVELDANSSDVQVIASADADAEQNGSTLALNETVLNLGYQSGVQQAVGLRFSDVDIPKGAKIIEAKIVLTASSSITVAAGGSPIWQIDVENVDDAAVYSAGSKIDDRSYGAAPQVAYITSDWTLNKEYEVDVTSLVQSVSDRSGWCGGNGMAFRINDTSGSATKREAYSYDGSVAKAPKLVVYYTYSSTDPGYTNSCVKLSKTYGETQKEDDAIAKGDGSTKFSNTNSSGLLPWSQITSSGSTKQAVVGVRFPNVDLPQGTEVTEATLAVVGRTAGSSLQALSIAAYNANDVSAFSSTLPTSPSLTTATTWNPGSIAAGTTYNVSVKDQVQAVLNRSGWVSGKAMGLRMTANSGNSVAAIESWDTNPASAPKLTVTYKVTNLNNLTTVRKQLNSQIQAISESGSTPLAMAMGETAAYMLGNKVYNYNSSAQTKLASDSSYYQTPINAEACVANRMLVVTDGEPTRDDYIIDLSKTSVLPTAGCSTSNSSVYRKDVLDTGNRNSWGCMNQMADTLRNASASLNTVKKVIKTSTMVVGSDLDADQVADLSAVATKWGDGNTYQATDPGQVVEAIKKELDELTNQVSSISAPGVAVNQFSRLNHLDQLYYAVFDPPDTAQARWDGNVKRYKLVIDDTSAKIVDKNGNDAIDPSTSFFKSAGISSWWSTNDNNKATLGGVAEQLPAPDNRAGSARKMYTYLGTYPTVPVSGSGSSLTQVDPTSSTFRSAMYNTGAGVNIANVPNSAGLINLMNWLLGYDVQFAWTDTVADTVDTTTGLRKSLGGVLHSRPQLVNYSYTGNPDLAATCPDGADSGGSCTNANSQTNVVFFSTMEGVLHAVNTRTGAEYFSFIPKETISQIRTRYDNPAGDASYGLDLSWTIFRKDGDGDSKILSSTSSDAVYMYGGMREGGKNYYALNVTDLTSPKLMWVIEGGKSGTAYEKMGQTWSQPTIANIKVNGTVRTVLVFGGGYDDKHETAGYVSGSDSGSGTRGSNNDYLGNQVYVVDYKTGELIAWASNTSGATLNNSNLKFAIPSEIKVKDFDRDGLADAFYFGDLGGQVFRIDINNANTGASTLMKRAARIANVGVAANANQTNQRRFYEAPSVATVLDSSGNPMVVVAMGSGYRSHPLDLGTEDSFFVFFDKDALRLDLLTTSTLNTTDVTLSGLAQVNLSVSTAVNTSGKSGWYMEFPSTGEKALASPLVYLNNVWFTSYVPGTTSGCQVVAGSTNLWGMNVLDATPPASGTGLSGVSGGTGTYDGRLSSGVVQGLGSEPQLVVTKGADGKSRNAMVVGTKVIKGQNLSDPKLQRTRWYEKRAD